MRVDESILTGEAKASKKWSQTLEVEPDLPIAERSNMAFMGTMISQVSNLPIFV